MQIIIILKAFKDFFACKIYLDANHHYPGNIQKFFRLQNCLRRKSSLYWKYSNIFRLQICLIRKSSLSWIYSKKFRLQKFLSHESALSWKNSKTLSPAKLSHPQIIIILEIFKNFFACKIVLDANHHYPENFQRLFCLQRCLSRNSSLSWKYSKTFSPDKTVFDANHHIPEYIQHLFPLQNCLRRKSSLSWNHSKYFLPAKLS